MRISSSHLGPACLGGKWERKENGEGKGGKGEHFPLLGRRENGRGKKMGKENSVGPSPIFPPTFSSQNGGILGQIFCFHSLPSCFSHRPTLLLIKLSSSSTLFFHSGQPLTSQKLSFTVQPSNIPLLLFSTEPESFSHFTFFLYMRDTKF